MEGHKAARGEKIPCSSPLLAWALYGGIPRNKITEFFGDPGGGKSTTAVDICKNAIEVFKREYEEKLSELRTKAGKGDKAMVSAIEDLQDRGPKKALYIDLEHSFDDAWSKTLGILDTDLEVMQPPDVVAEDILQTVQEIVETGEVGLIVIDSIPSLVPRAELEKKYGERTVASLAGLLAIFCRKIVSLLSRYECTMIFINQTRDNMDNPYVVNTPGGRAPKFYASLRIQFKIGSPVDFLGNELPKNAENPAGYLVNAQIVKQKSAPWDRKLASYYLLCTSGIRPDYDYAKLAVSKYNIIHKSGGWFTVTDPLTGEVLTDDQNRVIKINGMAKVYDYLATNPEYYAKLKKFIMDDINGSSDVSEPDADTITEQGIEE
jgi:recombination protein RecA